MGPSAPSPKKYYSLLTQFYYRHLNLEKIICLVFTLQASLNFQYSGADSKIVKMIVSSSKSFSGLVYWCQSRTLQCKQLRLNCENFNPRLYLHISAANQMARRWKKEVAFQSELTNPVEIVYGAEKKAPDDVGVVYDKKPFKINVKKYHLYTWCGCGRSHSQPFCDGTHASLAMKRIVNGGPVKYIAPEDREIWFCMCKQVRYGISIYVQKIWKFIAKFESHLPKPDK